MSDLISRDRLIEKITKHMNKPENADIKGIYEGFIRVLKCQPVACDVDKVVGQLEEFRAELAQFGADGILTDMLEIVRAGGKE